MSSPFVDLPEDERLEQVAALLVIGATRFLRRRGMMGRHTLPTTEPPKREIWDLVEDEVDRQILRHLHTAIHASPVKMGLVLGIPHSSLVRRLSALRTAGLVHVTGKTKGARYELAGRSGRN